MYFGIYFSGGKKSVPEHDELRTLNLICDKNRDFKRLRKIYLSYPAGVFIGSAFAVCPAGRHNAFS